MASSRSGKAPEDVCEELEAKTIRNRLRRAFSLGSLLQLKFAIVLLLLVTIALALGLPIGFTRRYPNAVDGIAASPTSVPTITLRHVYD